MERPVEVPIDDVGEPGDTCDESSIATHIKAAKNPLPID
jgi:hypothetical protein